ncbi:MAG: type I methionyl aminopeptidase [Deltaproteobacteria bacterium RBG_16_71_12]|nr:MAG: type I methionyl aminopeptidase [Deltaproteobacteria bacterium RBG_16_71_12]
MDARRESINLLSPSEVEAMRRAGRAAAEMIAHLASLVKPGISTADLDDAAVAWTSQRGYQNGPLNYHGFPRSICTSVNEVVCHGIPSKKQQLKDGDIINIDVTPIVDGWYGDTSRTFHVGSVRPQAKKLVDVTEECLRRAIAVVKPGARLGDIGAAIQELAEANGYSVVKDFVGHGIGRSFHTAPQVPHYGKRGKGPRLEKGMCFTIEPMINAGTWEIEVLDDGWTAVTRDRKLSAQFEHTVVVTEHACEVLTSPV